LAAGAGERFGGDTPKQFALLMGEPAFVHPLRVLVSCTRVDAIVVVLPAVRDVKVDEAARLPKITSMMRGGKTRQESLSAGMTRIPAQTTTVLVHDAARPFLNETQVVDVLDALEGNDGAISAVPLEDSIKQGSADGEILRSLGRDLVWRAQTPQAFHRGALEEGLRLADEEGFESTDCSELVVRAGLRVKLVEGDPYNMKLTRSEDLKLGEMILRTRSGVEYVWED